MSDVLLAYEMNGNCSPPATAFPPRDRIGWYAMASVKWLRRIIVTDKPFNGFYNRSITHSGTGREHCQRWRQSPTSKRKLKSPDQRMAKQLQPIQPTGFTARPEWHGRNNCVEISCDSAFSWRDAKLLGEPVKNSWRLWEYEWRTPAAAADKP